MKVLTIVSTILLPASVLFGFFGTNNLQAAPLLMGMGGFVIMLAMVALISAGSLLLFHRKGWL
jgi:magnesium transporter